MAHRVIERAARGRGDAVTPDELRLAMGRFATGVTVITSCDARGAPVGTTANAVTSLSLDPPLLIVCLERRSLTLAALRDYGAFAVNLLTRLHEGVSAAFARRGSDGAWTSVEHGPCASGCPALVGALATIDCTVEESHAGGDHEIVVGRVNEIRLADSAEAPLVFHQGRYVTLAPLR